MNNQTLSRARRWAAVAVLSASLLVITMDMTILNIALPELAGDVKPSSDQQLWIIDIYSLVLAGLLVSAAALADRWGRKRMLMFGYIVFALTSLGILVANSASAVIAVRALLGLGGAFIMPTTLSLIRVIFTDIKERAVALSVWASISGLGAAIGPLIGGLLLEHFSWHSAFLINIPLMIIAVIAGILILPESRVKNPGRWDGFAALLSLLGMTALVWSIKHFGKEASLASVGGWAAFVFSVVTLYWFTKRCLTVKDPLLNLRLFKNRPFSAGITAALGSTFAMIAALLLLAQWLQLVNGDSALSAGVKLVPMAIAGAVSSLVAPVASRVFSARAVLSGGLAISAIGMVVLGVQRADLSITVVMIALILIGAGIGSLALGSAMIMSSVSEDEAGNAGALEESSYELGGTLGVAVLGSISAIIYRAELKTYSAFKELQAYDPALAAQTKESLGAAVVIGESANLPEFVSAAGSAFDTSLEITGLAGGIMLIAVAVAVFFITPKHTIVA